MSNQPLKTINCPSNSLVFTFSNYKLLVEREIFCAFIFIFKNKNKKKNEKIVKENNDNSFFKKSDSIHILKVYER